MHRVISVNLNGNAYQIDEDGYNTLRDYLDRAKAGLRNNPDIEEILGDLERAIAEKCAGFLNPGKTVVSAAEIAQILVDMGPVVGDVAGGAEPGDRREGDTASPPRGPKRLYKIREGAMIGGVCTGLAEYLGGVDVTLVRLGFTLMGLLSGIGILGYVIMMLVVPYGEASRQPSSRVADGKSWSTTRVAVFAAILVVIGIYGTFSVMPLRHFGMVEMMIVGLGVGFWLLILLVLSLLAVSLMKHLRSNTH